MAQLKSTSVTGNLSVTGNVVASQIIKLDGTSDHILMSDGGIQNLNNFNHSIIFKQNNDLINQYNINNVNLLTATNISIISSNLNDSAYDRIYVGKNNNCSLQYRTKREFLKDLNLTLVYNFKGTVNNINALKNISSANVGDVYSILDTGDNWACKQKVTSTTGDNYETYWSNLGQNVDLSGYMTLDTEQTISGVKTFTTILMNGNGPITFPQTPISGNNQYSSNHYISAGSGYSTDSGKNGMKLICCDQSDAATGMGQDLGKGTTVTGTSVWNYDTWLVGGKNGNTSTNGYISFGFHTNHNADYDRVSYINATGDFYTRGNIYSNNKKAVTLNTNTNGTVTYIPKFTDINIIENSNITDDGSTITLGSKIVVKGNGTSYNEGIRILPANNSWANIFFSANATTSSNHATGWLVGRRGAQGSNPYAAAGDFTIEENSSDGANLTIHQSSGGATLIGGLRLKDAINTTASGTFKYNTTDKCIDVIFT